MNDTEPARARNTDPQTSHVAAASVQRHLSKMDTTIVQALRARSQLGATTLELEQMTGLGRVSISPRLRPLQRRGRVKDSGGTRPGTNGRPSIVWQVA